jgi:hypothetical protein
MAAGLALSACGSSPPPSPPSAKAIIHKLGCFNLGTDTSPVASQYTVTQDRVAGSSDGTVLCTSAAVEDVVTFPSSADESKWLDAFSSSGASENSCVSAVIGPLWAVTAFGAEDMQPIIRRLGGKNWSGGC